MNNISIGEFSQTARAMIQQQRYAEVIVFSKQIQVIHPNAAEVHFVLGLAEKRSRNLQGAKQSFEKAINLDTQRYDAAIELAELLVVEGDFKHAFFILTHNEPKLVKSSYYLNIAGTCYTKIGMHEKAWESFKLADKVQPNTDSILANLADCAVLMGKAVVAMKIYQKIIEKYPSHQKTHYEFSKIKKADNASHINEMKALLHNSNLPPHQNIYLYYALGKELEDLEQWEESFSFYEKAGKTILSKANYSVKPEVDAINSIINLCDKSWLTDNTSTPPKMDKTPIFIVGLPRTGTTLIERVLASHSKIESADETFFMTMAINKERNIKGVTEIDSQFIKQGVNANIHNIAENYLSMIDYKLSDKPYFVEKYPFNFLLLGFIAKAFPTAKIIYLNRHPMDACFAMFKQSYFKFAYSLADLAEYYVAQHKLHKHWKRVLGNRLIELSYEDFVTSQETSTTLLFNQLDIEFEQACLEFYKNTSASATASTLQVREKVHNRSINKWTHYKPYLAPLEEMLNKYGIDTKVTIKT